MSSLPQPWSIKEWQTLAAKSPADAARELDRRVRETFSANQHRAVFAKTFSEAELIAAFERVTNTIAPLAGVPYVLKDLFYTANDPLQAGGNLPPGVIPPRPRDSKLPHALRGFGAILAGKTQLHEFAYGLTGENPHYGDVAHPRFADRTSGGSSSGSAAAVAAGIVPFGAGTDTAGSIRVPAAFCGLYGFRTPAAHPLITDAFPLAPSFDTAGWFARTADDLLFVHRYLIGKVGQADRTPRGCFVDFDAFGVTADTEVATAYRKAAERFGFPADSTTAGQLAEAFRDAAKCYAVLQSIEAFNVHKAWLDTHRSHYGEAVWARIDRGRKWSDADQQSARIRHTIIKNTWANFFLTYDYLVMPIAPFPALKKSECTQENRDRLLAINTPVSLGGLPVIVVPIPLREGLSTGLQIVLNNPLSPVIPWLLKR
jgi:aspartyl-tRNA(Asn)/glutamyl-tRNA(Gln) amidotransferase subunit A